METLIFVKVSPGHPKEDPSRKKTMFITWLDFPPPSLGYHVQSWFMRLWKIKTNKLWNTFISYIAVDINFVREMIEKPSLGDLGSSHNFFNWCGTKTLGQDCWLGDVKYFGSCLGWFFHSLTLPVSAQKYCTNGTVNQGCGTIRRAEITITYWNIAEKKFLNLNHASSISTWYFAPVWPGNRLTHWRKKCLSE